MKTLTLLRHAKSSWDNPETSDIERPLSRRGKEDAPCLAEDFAARDNRPQLILSSPAKRALATSRYFARALKTPVETDERIYAADANTLLDVIRGIDEKWEHVLLVGHNPGLEEIIRLLTGRPFDRMPTCGLVCLRIETPSWPETAPGSNRQILFLNPKQARKKTAARRFRPDADEAEGVAPDEEWDRRL